MDVLVTLVKRALAYVKSVRHICVDRWFSSPAQIVALRDATGLHVITVLKHGNAKFEFNGVEMTIKQIFEQVKKNKGRSRYLSEALIKIVKNGVAIKVVFVRNRANRKEWIAIATTDTSLASEDIIEYYALRWDIEKYFWTIKMHLHLTDECHSTSYDALTAHATIVAVRYMLLAYEKRNNEDDKTFGGLIAMISEEAKSMAVSEILGVFADAVFDSIDHVVGMTNEMKEMFVDQLLSRLPEDVTKLLAFAYGKSGGEASAGQA